MLPRGGWNIEVLLCLGVLAAPLGASVYNCAPLSVPGTPTGINNAGVIVGSGGGHGYIRDAAGNVTQVDYPGKSGTQLLAINNQGVITGQWIAADGTSGLFTVDPAGNFHNVVLPAPYDAQSQVINGINDGGAVLAAAFTPNSMTALIVNPDGSVSTFPLGAPMPSALLIGSLDNAGQFLVPATLSFGVTRLFSSDGSFQQIAWTGPGNIGQTVATALNNVGMVAGYFGAVSGALLISPMGFVRDAAGNFSGLSCMAQPVAINDAGVVVGVDQSGSPSMAVPAPGSPQMQLSVSSIAFAPMAGGTTSAPIPFTVSNTGDGRLDLGGPGLAKSLPPTTPFFQVTPCQIGGTTVNSLNPGESCTASVTASPTTLTPGVYSGTVFLRDSSPGSPHGFPVAVTVDSGIPPGGPQWTSLGMRSAGRVAAITDGAGIDEAFVRGTDNALWHASRNGPGGGWSAWVSFGGVLSNDPVVFDSGSGLQVYVFGGDSALWRISQTSPGSDWSGRSWEALGGGFQGEPAVVLDATAQPLVVARGTDNALWWERAGQPGGVASGWSSLGGLLSSNPAAAVDGKGRVNVFVFGFDQALWQISQDPTSGNWSAWVGLSGMLTDDPAAIRNALGGMEVFARGGDGGLWHIAQNGPGGAWSGWSGLGGLIQGSPAVAMNQDLRLDVFAVGSDSALWHIAQLRAAGAWLPWEGFPGGVGSAADAFRNPAGLLEAYVRGADGSVQEIQQGAPGVWH